MIVSINEQMLFNSGGVFWFILSSLNFACGECQLIILLKLKFWWIIAHFWFTAKVLASKFGFDRLILVINSINGDQKILNHFFFLFIFCLVWGWPRPGGCGPICTIEAGARLEVVSCDEGEENPANETGPVNKGQGTRYKLVSNHLLLFLTRGRRQPEWFLRKHRISVSVVSEKREMSSCHGL